MSEEESCLSSSNRFKIKAILVWLIICVPGNIFAIICIYSSKTNYTFISEQNYTNPAWHQKPIENLNASRDSERNETTIRDFRNQATIEIPNSSEVVSKFYNISNITQLYFYWKTKKNVDKMELFFDTFRFHNISMRQMIQKLWRKLMKKEIYNAMKVLRKFWKTQGIEYDFGLKAWVFSWLEWLGFPAMWSQF